MFVICRNGHLGFWWEGNCPVFVEKDSGIFPSRKQCLNYLIECGLKKEQAVSTIALMQKKTGNWISF